MTIKVYNTLSRKKEIFRSIQENKVNMYACGPTVYNYVHIGNARMAVFFDVVRRFLSYSGYDVTYVQNITDVDDKIIQAANETGKEELAISSHYTDEYNQDLASLSVMSPTVQPKVSEHIPQIVSFIQQLIDKGMAYEQNGDVYYRVTQFKGYGKLSNQILQNLQHTNRSVYIAEEKENEHDFALWKKQKEDEIAWNSPWGKGRPGWHIECSVMSMNYLGETFDIHGGGLDLCFPHHENEIAQSEGLTGKPFAHYWMHNNYITVNGQKMSKSLGNFTTVRDALKTYDGNTLRMFFLSVNYRNEIDYSEESMEQAKQNVEKISQFLFHLNHLENTLKTNSLSKEVKELITNTKDSFSEQMSDDFNTSEALTLLLSFMKNIYSLPNLTKEDAKESKKVIKELLEVLGFTIEDKKESKDEEIQQLVEQRDALKEQAKMEKEKEKKIALFQEADDIRSYLLSQEVVVEDTPQGTRWRKK